ncbi:glycogen debranching protein GlgX [Microbacterium sp. ZXX196]|uniref:glycogen debranching protein GlgX n=1 Tax=Microbacterium sp. ZXX196 TaxID=2609291 RepID=UPI0012B9135D|nr:glycogen debranching protein GlgX [Microbacterium sp. ZXX196]MTE23869.1 glycogen debranching protein GlgX [Microbacterium sp. ZXX196]
MSPKTWNHVGETTAVWPGRNWPLGASWHPEATNFAVYAPDATGVWVCLFDESGAERRVPLSEKDLGIWHGALPGVEPGQLYGFRADGPWDPENGYRFNIHKLLLDPYAHATSGEIVPEQPLFAHEWDDHGARNDDDSAPVTARSVVVDRSYDWGDDEQPKTAWRDTVVYELHVKGFTQLHDRVPEEIRGTYSGLAHPHVIDYLKDLGVTAVELLPTQQFFSEPALLERGATNYWGYNTAAFFSPHGAYSSRGDRGGQVAEFKDMVRAFHAAGLEVILDVVYNHTAEAGSAGPVLSFRGLDDRGAYKRIVPHSDDAFDDSYWDVTGCGNTVDTSEPMMLRLIMDSLRYWVNEMHVDGFRFDLTSALTRTGYDIDMACSFLTAVDQDPVLRHVKLIAEPWDASMDGYLVGQMPAPWVEWNDQYRGAIRDLWRGEGNMSEVATRVAGSSDLYRDDGRWAYAGVNFVTAHDGFTVRDLVSYAHKHNEENGEDNRDGSDDNRSNNHGVEGETDDEQIVAVRRRQAANIMVTLALSNGVPMITAGDERGRTQGGNNNAYCQDNEISWVDWSADDAWLDVYEQTRRALQLRRDHPVLRQRHWFQGEPTLEGGPDDLAWLHPAGRRMTEEDWADPGLRTLGFFLSGGPLREPGLRGEQVIDRSFIVWINAADEDVEVASAVAEFMPEGEVVLSTDPRIPLGSSAVVGQADTITARCIVVARAA